MQLSLWPTPTADESGVRPLPRHPGASRTLPSSSEGALPILKARAEQYVQEAHCERTRKAYRRDWQAFEVWCGENQLDALPASPHTLELYLTYLAQRGRKASTIRRARIAIGLAHGHSGEVRPDQHARIRTLERGIAKTHGAREEGATPLLPDQLAIAVRALGHSAREDRDRAMLLVGFAGAFRSSDLAGLNVTDVTFTSEGLTVELRRSKEDQTGKGKRKYLPFGSSELTCPVRALRAWLGRVGRPAGPLFRVIRGGVIEHQRIHPRAVSRALQRAVTLGQLVGKYSSHSLRAGLATSAHVQGVSRRDIQEHVGWEDARSVDRYIRLERVHGRKNIAEGLL